MKKSLFVLGLCALFAACQSAPTEEASSEAVDKSGVQHPAWSKDASIYEVNIRQYTPEGTINAFRNKLPELKELGVDILWIMPIQPIGVKNRKGGLGSYYSISDYTAVNPEFGTADDFRALVQEAHAMGMKIILDWVANHTSWDAVWMETHPDWYTRNADGQVVSPVEDWSDVADLNYDNAEMRTAMLEAMKYWVREFDIDGYRCDVAMMVPMDFWDRSRAALDSIKPVFMLAEAEGPEFHEKAFDMTYGWEFHHVMNQIAKDLEPISTITEYVKKNDSLYPEDAYRMYFTTNHDENSWNGTVFERMGANHLNFFILCNTLPQAMPLIYSGQEAGLSKRLSFFEKDTILWDNKMYRPLYTRITELKSSEPLLRNGAEGGDFKLVQESEAEKLYAFSRFSDAGEMLVILNFSEEAIRYELPEDYRASDMLDLMSGETLAAGNSVAIPANGHALLKIQQK